MSSCAAIQECRHPVMSCLRLSNSRAWAARSNAVVAGRWLRSASLVSSSARHDLLRDRLASSRPRPRQVPGDLVDKPRGERVAGTEAEPGVEHPAGQSGMPASWARRQFAPAPARMPSDSSGWAKTACSLATRRSQASASSQPPPRAGPSIRAIDRPAMRLEPLEQPGVYRLHGGVGVTLAELGDVGAGGEHARGRRVDDQHAGLVPGVRQDGADQVVDHRLVDGVALGGTDRARSSGCDSRRGR